MKVVFLAKIHAPKLKASKHKSHQIYVLNLQAKEPSNMLLV